MVKVIGTVLIQAFLLLRVVSTVQAQEPKALPAPSQPAPPVLMPAPQVMMPAPAPPMDAAPPMTRSMRRQPLGTNGDGGRPDETVGGLPGAKPSVPDRQP
jgi:hypothetical protein